MKSSKYTRLFNLSGHLQDIPVVCVCVYVCVCVCVCVCELLCLQVMLITNPALEDFYSKSCGLAQEDPDSQDSYQHPTRLLQFLVGTRGKNEPMAIGGPWSPSLDGADPEENPQVLIKTAIRCTKALTGIDLSKCTQWWVWLNVLFLFASVQQVSSCKQNCICTFSDQMHWMLVFVTKLQPLLW